VNASSDIYRQMTDQEKKRQLFMDALVKVD
jgi:hypothetical protein